MFTVRELIQELIKYDVDTPVSVVIDSETSYPFDTENWAPKFHLHEIAGACKWSHTAGIGILLKNRKGDTNV